MNTQDRQRPLTKRKTVDIFCRVVDNYGDAGICWRLARQMAFEHGLKVRLIIDQLDVLASLVPRLAKALHRTTSKRARVRSSRSPAPAFGYLVDGVRVFEWNTRKSPSRSLIGPARLLKPASLVIAAFACDLPESYRSLMEGAAKTSVWMNHEYLSGETWVETHHLLPSPKPSGLIEHFFFPGFNERTGGLIRERALLAKRDAFLQDRQAQEKLAAELGISALFDRPRETTLLIFVFSYPQAPLQGLVQGASLALRNDLVESRAKFQRSDPNESQPLPLRNIERIWFLCPDNVGHLTTPGASPAGVEVKTIPRLPQERFDEILWLSDANFVRGEDSFVRAIWAGKPMIWNIYPQQDKAHQLKLEAFLARRPAEERGLSLAWNQLDDTPDRLPDIFRRWLEARFELAIQSRNFAAELTQQDDLCLQVLRAGKLSD